MPISSELNFTLFCIIILFLLFIKSAESVPDDYCLAPLNLSNCGFPPTPVFHYYKSGSRCEIQFWRGCPTANLFRNEYDCSHHCIGRLWKIGSKENTENDIIGIEERLKWPKNPCDKDITTFKCTDRKEMVFTYDNEKKACVQKVHYGCVTRNKFFDKQRCEEMCQKEKIVWKNINNLNEKELKDINDILDKVNEDFQTTPHQTTSHTAHHTTQHKHQLKHFKHKRSTTTAAHATETTSTSVVTNKPSEAVSAITKEIIEPTNATETTVETTEATHDIEITEKTTEATHAIQITDETTEVTRAIEITEKITEATRAIEITEETTEVTQASKLTKETTKAKLPPDYIEEFAIIRSRHKLPFKPH